MAADLYPLVAGAKVEATKTTNRIKETHISVTGTLLAANWVHDTSITAHKIYYNTFSNANIQANSLIELYPNGTYAQNMALRNAFLVFKAQADGKIELYCYGEVPSIDIPIRIIIKKDMITL